jgi:integrase/recombinase XerD
VRKNVERHPHPLNVGCKPRVRDYQRGEGILHFRIEGKGDKVRFIPVAPQAKRLIHMYPEAQA